MSKIIKCAGCGDEFEASREEEEALAEAKKNFPNVAEEDFVAVCSDCFRIGMQRAEAARQEQEALMKDPLFRQFFEAMVDPSSYKD